MPKTKPKESQITRQERLEIIFKWQEQIKNAERDLITPLGDFISLFLFPALVFFYLHIFSRFRDTYVELANTQDRARYQEGIKKFYEESRSAEGVRKCRSYLDAQIPLYENHLVEWSQPLNIVETETNATLKYHFADLETAGDRHLLHALAKIGAYFPEVDGHIKKIYMEVINATLMCTLQLVEPAPIQYEELLRDIPELSQCKRSFACPGDFEQKLSAVRLVEILKRLWRIYADFDAYLLQIIDETIGLHFNKAAFSALIAVSAATGIVLKPLVTRLLRPIFPLRLYINPKFYQPMQHETKSDVSLENFQKEMEIAVANLARYANRNKKISKILYALIIAIGLTVYFTVATSNMVLLIVPVVISAMLQLTLTYNASAREKNRVTKQLNGLENKLKSIMGIDKQCFQIIREPQQQAHTSIVRIKINKKHEVLSAQKIAKLLANSLLRFKVWFYIKDSEIILPAACGLNDPAPIKNHFDRALKRAIEVKALKQKMRGELAICMRDKFETPFEINIIQDVEGLEQLQIVVKKSRYKAVNKYLKDLGFIDKGKYLEFIAFAMNDSKLQNACRNLKSFDIQQAEDQINSIPAAVSLTSMATSNPHRTKEKFVAADILEESETKIEPQKSIIWPKCGARFPDKGVSVVEGTINQYLFWDLTPDDFGDFPQSYESFKEKSTQLASRAHDAQGIKVRPTYGRGRSGQYQFFDARIKRVGDQGDKTVYLSIEKGPGGETLYRTEGFGDAHRKLRR
ncbi:MAG: hypothetical protein JSS53_04055 [Proteobacteria bacterium]|nr:hypothetical protein [Pseudomonadota bacterium]